MLTEVGQDQARAIGAAFRNAGIPVGRVLGSGLCRAIETGRLAFGRVEASDALLIESFVPIAGAPVPPPWPQVHNDQGIELFSLALSVWTEGGGIGAHRSSNRDHEASRGKARARTQTGVLT